MKTQNDSLISSPVAIVGEWVSEPIWAAQLLSYSVQLSFDSATAIIKLQCSNDSGKAQSQKPSSYDIKTWTDIDYSDVAINGSGNGVFDVTEVGYRWVRVVITGSVNLNTLRINSKGL